MRRIHRKALFIVAACVLAAGGVVGGLLGSQQSEAAPATSASVGTQLLADLNQSGLSVDSASVSDGTLAVAFAEEPRTAENAIDRIVRLVKLQRAAANNGFNDLSYSVTIGDETYRERVRLRLHPVASEAADQSIADIREWLERVESLSGVKTAFSVTSGRVDVHAVGSVDQVSASIEHFMNGGDVLYAKGAFDLLTVRAETPAGVVLFNGVGDYLLGTTYAAYVAPGLTVDW